MTKSSPKCDQVVASSASLSFCARAHKMSRGAATNLSSAITAVMGRTVCGLGNGFGFSVSRKTKRQSIEARETGRQAKTVDNCFREAETAQSKERPKRAGERHSATMRRWWGTFNSRGNPRGALVPLGLAFPHNRGDGKLTKSSPKCDQVVASSASLSFCARAHKMSRGAATNLSSAITAVMGRTVCGLGNGFGFSVSRKTKRQSIEARETGRQAKTVDNCFREAETAQSKERPKRAGERHSATMRRWWGTFNSRGIPRGALVPSRDGIPAPKRKADKRLLACFLVRETGIEPVR